MIARLLALLLFGVAMCAMASEPIFDEPYTTKTQEVVLPGAATPQLLPVTLDRPAPSLRYSRILGPGEPDSFNLDDLFENPLRPVGKTKRNIALFACPTKLDAKLYAIITRHASVYDAIGQLDPIELYDTLAANLEGALLDDEFQRILGNNKSLKRENNDVRILALVYEAVAPAPEAMSFRISWWLYGRLHHLQHVHRRLIKFRAIVRTNGKTGKESRIVAVDLKEVEAL